MPAPEIYIALKLSLISEAEEGLNYEQSVAFNYRLLGALIVDVPAHVLIGAIAAARSVTIAAVTQ